MAGAGTGGGGGGEQPPGVDASGRCRSGGGGSGLLRIRAQLEQLAKKVRRLTKRRQAIHGDFTGFESARRPDALHLHAASLTRLAPCVVWPAPGPAPGTRAPRRPLDKWNAKSAAVIYMKRAVALSRSAPPAPPTTRHYVPLRAAASESPLPTALGPGLALPAGGPRPP